MAQKTFPVLRALLHDGTLYDPEATPGVTVDLDETFAAELPDGVLGEGIAAIEGDGKAPKPPKT